MYFWELLPFEVVPHDVPSDYVGLGIVVDHKQCAADVERRLRVSSESKNMTHSVVTALKPAVTRAAAAPAFFRIVRLRVESIVL